VNRNVYEELHDWRIVNSGGHSRSTRTIWQTDGSETEPRQLEHSRRTTPTRNNIKIYYMNSADNALRTAPAPTSTKLMPVTHGSKTGDEILRFLFTGDA